MTGKISRLLFCIAFLAQLHSLAWCNTSEQQKIDSAVDVIKSYGLDKNIAILQGNNYTHKPISIIFKNLAEVDFTYARFYAITATDDKGGLYILLNDNLRNSDTKALACLILHETNHCKKNIADSISEELMAHTQEVMLYIRILGDDEDLQYKTEDRLVVRLNKLKKIYDDAIRGYIVNNSNYVNYLKKE